MALRGTMISRVVPSARAVAMRRRPEIRLISPKKFPAVSSATGTSSLFLSGTRVSATRPPAMIMKSFV